MTKSKGRKRESITDAVEMNVIAIIDGWDPSESPLTQSGLERRVKDELNMTLTRQGLMKRDNIRLAFEARDKEINGEAKPKAENEPLTVILERRVAEIAADMRKKDEAIANYKVMFATYRYNARQLGITREQLEAPIPPRGQIEGARG